MDSIVDFESAQIDDDIQKTHDEFKIYLDKNKKMFFDSVDTEMEKKNLEQTFTNLKIMHNAGSNLFNAIKNKMGKDEMGKFDDVIDNMQDKTSKLIQENVLSISEEYREAAVELLEIDKSSTTMQYTITCIISLLIVIGSFLFSNYLTSQISTIVNLLTAESQSVNLASNSLEEVSTNLSNVSTEQAAALQETSSAISEITAMVQKNIKATSDSLEDSEMSKKKATEGQITVDDMISSIHQVAKSNDKIISEVDKNNEEIQGIVEVIKEIEQKTQVINDIVFQTKLLSFNASVEAARAGEHGKGFSVVAEEVGNLAQMSGQAATEISSLLESSINKVNSIVSTSSTRISTFTDEGKEKVEQGSKIASDCKAVFDVILDNVNTVNDRVSEISSASTEQARGTEEISTAISQLDTGSQEIANLSQQSLQASNELKQRSISLNSVVGSLNSLLEGSTQTMTRHSSEKITNIKRKQNESSEEIPNFDDSRFEDIS